MCMAAEILTYTRVEEACPASFAAPASPMPQTIHDFLKNTGMQLYSHQASSYDAASSGKNIIITTPTASGKTFCYALPVFSRLLENPDARALFIYPTKALTRDQLLVLEELDAACKTRARPAVYDGDTRTELRAKIRDRSRIVLTNMYELHHMLSWRSKWADFFTNLSFVVIDEAHRYRGVFGSNTALLLRRLRRVCAYNDAYPQFILSSATLGNSVHFAETLTGLAFEEISNDGAPHAKKTYKIYCDEGKSAIASSASLVAKNIEEGRQTICFSKSRAGTELTAQKCRESANKSNVVSYRGGYRPAERRGIETDMKSGAVSGVFSTNALEVGIDIGGIDSVVISGFPDSMTSFMQQAGRAGRKGQDAEITFVAGMSPIDRFYVNNPEAFFSAGAEEAILGLENPYILRSHLICACAEIPWKPERDRRFFGPAADEIIASLKAEHLVASTSKGYVYSGHENPAQTLTYFGNIGKTWSVRLNGTTLETMDDGQSYREAYPGAVILHQGEKYRVIDRDAQNCFIHVVKTTENYRTRPLSTTDISVNTREKTVRHKNLLVHFGDVTVTTHITGYSVIEYDQVVLTKELEYPARTFKTKACWITFDETAPLTPENIAGSLHGTEHALIAAMPVFVLSDRADIGGVSTPMHADTASPAVFIYDGVEGGIGLAEKAAELFPKIISLAEKMVSECKCKTGCPACIQSPRCGNNNQYLDKEGTKMLLSYLVEESGQEEKKGKEKK